MIHFGSGTGSIFPLIIPEFGRNYFTFLVVSSMNRSEERCTTSIGQGHKFIFFFVRNCSSVSKIQLHAHILNFREYTLEVIFAYSFSKVAYYMY